MFQRIWNLVTCMHTEYNPTFGDFIKKTFQIVRKEFFKKWNQYIYIFLNGFFMETNMYFTFTLR